MVAMHLTIFQIVNYFLLLIFLVLFIRYLWIVFIFRDKFPIQWHNAVKNHQVPSRLKSLERKYSDKVRFFNWWIQIERLKHECVPGVFVELGVYKGESAQIIHRMDPNRQFHLFDTFSGFTATDLVVETGEAASYTPDNFADTNVQSVLKKIDGNQNIIIHQGYFPDTSCGFCEQIALVNMDVDLYSPTKAGLEFFYPLLAPGGIIMVHDYNYKWPGILKAVDDFIQTIPENLVVVPDISGTAMIIRNK